MAEVIRIASEAQLAEIVAAATDPLDVAGRATKRGFGRPVAAATSISLADFTGVIAYEHAELLLEVRAGTSMAEIAAVLAQGQQELAFEPPDLGPLFGHPPGCGSIGGVIACNLAGPRRIRAGGARDHLLGVTAVSGRGEIFKAGGRVVKNVTGYDLCKLLAGSFGTLAVMTTLNLKVLPAPEKVRTLLLVGLNMPAAWAAMTQALSSGHEVSAAAFVPATLTSGFAEPRLGPGQSVTALRLEGPPRSVEDRMAGLRAVLGGQCEELHSANSRAFWRQLRDVQPFVDDVRAVWRISTPPQGGLIVAKALEAIPGADAFFDWGGGLIWGAVPDTGTASAEVLRAAVAAAGGGHATLVRAADATRVRVPPFQPLASSLAALEARIKQVFDPKDILNPGRMWPAAGG
jgi:glycolate oxidase FAD binding subunit